jgi:phosphatidylinositol-3-phosphatase
VIALAAVVLPGRGARVAAQSTPTQSPTATTQGSASAVPTSSASRTPTATPTATPTSTTTSTPTPISTPTPTPPPPPPPPTPPPPPPPPAYNHVVVIVMENHSLEQVLGSPEAPYLNSLAAANGLATGYSDVSHPSLPNYLALTGGSTFGISSDCTDCFLGAPSIADRLEAAGKTWKAYQEGMPSPCFVGSSGRYAQKHDPFIYFNDIRNDPNRCGRIVPYTQMVGDFNGGSAPNFAFITPDLCNDTHDCALSVGDGWLSREVPKIMSSSAFSGSRSLLVITFDEGENGSELVMTVFAGSGVKAGYRSSAGYDHYSLLRTIEDNWGLAPLAGGDGGASSMKEFFAG